MEQFSHSIGVAIIAAVLLGVGAFLALLYAVALGHQKEWRPTFPVLLAVGPPAVLWVAFSLYLVAEVTADPSAGNLWPLTILLMALLWLFWIAVVWVLAALFHRVWRR